MAGSIELPPSNLKTPKERIQWNINKLREWQARMNQVVQHNAKLINQKYQEIKALEKDTEANDFEKSGYAETLREYETALRVIEENE